jgi:hypothetical protein
MKNESGLFASVSSNESMAIWQKTPLTKFVVITTVLVKIPVF